MIAHNQSENKGEYPLPSLSSNFEERIQPRPMKHSRSNSRLKGIQKPNKIYHGDKKISNRKSSVQFNGFYSDYPSMISNHDDALKLKLDIPNRNHKIAKKKFVGNKKPSNKIRKHIRITDQCSQYVDNHNNSWFNFGDEEAESYGVKVVEDVSMYLVDGDITDEEEETDHLFHNSTNLYNDKDFNEVKQFKHKLKL